MISIIIPAYNDEKLIQRTISYVYANAAGYKRLLREVIVVDGGSSDRTVEEAWKTGATVLRIPRKDRITQLNYGARKASGEILYFLNAHSLPPKNFISEIVKATSKGHACGTFSLEFDYKHWLLNALSWSTKHHTAWIHLSDQSLFVTKELFDKAGGFRSDHFVMGNQELIRRLKRYTNFIVLKDNIISSASRYLRYGIFRTEFIHGLAYVMQKFGYSQNAMIQLYRKFFRWDIGPKKKESKKMKTPASVPAQKKESQVQLVAPLQR